MDTTKHIPERWKAEHQVCGIGYRTVIEELGAAEAAIAEAQKELKPFRDVIANDGEYMDADGIIKAFIHEQERLREQVAQQEAYTKSLENQIKDLEKYVRELEAK